MNVHGRSSHRVGLPSAVPLNNGRPVRCPMRNGARGFDSGQTVPLSETPRVGEIREWECRALID